MKKIRLTINGKEVLTEPQKTILQVVEENHLDEIPILCYDPRLPPYGACFLCVVEVEGRRGLIPSCSTMVEDGMVIHTSNPKIHEARKTCLELILSDHYADCFGPCRLRCPAEVDVQGYISLINLGRYRDALKLIKERNPLPLVCGRICVRECEIACRRGRVDAPVGIDYLKRYVADHHISEGLVPEGKPKNGRAVAVIGGGPSGLTCAYYLALEGYIVTIFDSMPRLGGMLRYGIPEYRLPNEILDKEIDSIIALGIGVMTNCKLGEDFHIPDLFKRGYHAVFIGLGAQQSTDMGIQGEGAEGVIPGIDFLRDIQLKGIPSLNGRVVVVGGGNTAIDAARTSLRLGADEVTLLYRRTIQEMPAHSAEIKAAEDEGVNFIFLSAPTRVITRNGRLSAIECIKMSLGEPDASGRRRPVPIKGSEYILNCNYVISAIGQSIDPSGLEKEGKIEITRKGTISVNPHTLETSYPGVFAGGDVISGPATAVEAIAHGRRAAISIHNYLSQHQKQDQEQEQEQDQKQDQEQEQKGSVISGFKSKKDIFGGPDEREFDSIPNIPRQGMSEIPVAQRIGNFHEIETGFKEEQVKIESSRCLECGCNYIYDCLLRKYATQYGVTDLSYKGDVNRYKIDDRHPLIVLDPNKCIKCGRCVRTCAEILDVSALGFLYRGFKTIVKPAMEKPLHGTNCISCGNCISVCPTGAITEKLPYKKHGPWVMEERPSLCHYCSLGCNLNIRYKGDDLFFVTTSNNSKSLDNGYLCFKGRFGYYYHLNRDRNITPKIKREGGLVDLSWEEAIGFTSQRVIEIKERYGPDSIALFASPRLSNEELYLIQRLGRGVIGTNNIGSLANLLIPKDVNALDKTFGITASTNTMMEIKEADVIILINSDPTEEHPVLGFTIKNLVKKNLTKLIVIRSMEIDMVRYADIWLDSRKRSNTVLLNGIMRWIIQNNRENMGFINENTTGFQGFKEMLEKITIDDVSNITGVSIEKIRQCAEIISDPDLNLMIIFNIDSMTERSKNDLQAIGNLLLLTGKIGRSSNGLILLREHCNSQGLMDMGISQRYLPGYIPTTDTTDNEEILSKMAKGTIKASLIFGENPLKDHGNRKYLQSCEFLMVQDIFLTESCREAHIVLPSSTMLETSGTYTNFERRIQRTSRIFPPMCGMENWQTLSQLAEGFGPTWGYQSPEDIFKEILKVTDFLPELGFNEIEAKGRYWNLPGLPKHENNFLFETGFNLLDKKGRFQTYSSELDIPPYQILPYCSICEEMEVFKDRIL